jgi:hypothetical protein
VPFTLAKLWMLNALILNPIHHFQRMSGGSQRELRIMVANS